MTLPKFLIVMVYSKLLLSKLNAFDQVEVRLEYQIVPDHDADPAVGRYPESAAASQALLGHVTGDVVETVFNDEAVRLRVEAIREGD
ncbi:GreA/GreB family elongation factor [Nocardia carnea]|uniref:GreA/GreB family elongation factor n=1 Tax=Nocardia carnea TaxID=37328 RepID=UPI0024545BBC|nr:GreA/GreB family elongation factor [Nocardia carnea]